MVFKVFLLVLHGNRKIVIKELFKIRKNTGYSPFMLFIIGDMCGKEKYFIVLKTRYIKNVARITLKLGEQYNIL